MPYLQRSPAYKSEDPIQVAPVFLAAFAVILAACFTHGDVSNILFLIGVTGLLADRALGFPRIVFPKKSAAQNRPHP